jgi:hypothetical protein
MATAKPKLQLTDEELIALVRELSAAPRADNPWGRVEKSRPLADDPMWPSAPDGVENPLWEIVRFMPTQTSWYAGARPEPDPHWATLNTADMHRAYGSGLDRHSLCARYAWSIPSPGDMQWLKDLLGEQGVVEVGAGSGYWAWQMAQSGIDTVAYDPHPPGPENRFATHRMYHPVGDRDHSAVEQHPDRALLLCWPPYASDMAELALKAYGGDVLIYVGEAAGGCTADDGFFGLLDTGWDEIGQSPFHVTYNGIHCTMTAYRRNPA